MAIRAPTVRTHLSADALFGLLRTGFAAIADHRPGKPDISLMDALGSVHMTQDTCGKKVLPTSPSAVLACLVRLQKEF